MKAFWNERYGQSGYAYGERPNEFFAAQLQGLKPGKVLLPGDGEGRNGVFAARLGWQVWAFDYSESGKKKALALAEKEEVGIHYEVCSAEDYEPPAGLQFDLIGLIYFHLPPDIRHTFHQKLRTFLRPGGKVVLEVFHPRQLSRALASGGPKSESLLYDAEMVRNDFNYLDFELLEEVREYLEEGQFHQGEAEVVRMVGTIPAG